MRSKILALAAVAAIFTTAAHAADLSSGWERASAAAKNPVSAERSIEHQAVKVAGRPAAHTAGSTTTYVNNATSGVELDNIGVRAQRIWNNTTSLQVISATWSVPNVEMTAGVCNSGPEKAAELVALDTVDYSYPVLAGGLFMGADCEGSAVTQNYTPFFQVYSTVYDINMTVHPGDVLTTWVYYSGPTEGSIYIVDVTSGDFYETTVSLASLPSGVVAIGDSAAWWVDAQQQPNNGVEPLVNFVASFMTDALVADGASPANVYGAGAPGSLNSTLFQDGNFSSATVLGASALSFQTTACTRNLSNCN
jgi:hypothetical protein